MQAERDHGEGVANEDDIHAGGLGEERGGVVVGGEHCYGVVGAVEAVEVGDCDGFLVGAAGWGWAWGVGGVAVLDEG